MSIAFSRGFGWLVGVLFALVCCIAVLIISYKAIQYAAVAWDEHEAAQQAAIPAADTRPTTNVSASPNPQPAPPPRPEPPEPRGFQVRSARFYFNYVGDAVAPIIEMEVCNHTDHKVGRLRFCATLTAPGRTHPLAEDYFQYTIANGLAPGQTDQWRLLPERDSDWAKAPRANDRLKLEIVLIEVEDLAGNPIPGWRASDHRLEIPATPPARSKWAWH